MAIRKLSLPVIVSFFLGAALGGIGLVFLSFGDMQLGKQKDTLMWTWVAFPLVVTMALGAVASALRKYLFRGFENEGRFLVTLDEAYEEFISAKELSKARILKSYSVLLAITMAFGGWFLSVFIFFL